MTTPLWKIVTREWGAVLHIYNAAEYARAHESPCTSMSLQKQSSCTRALEVAGAKWLIVIVWT